MSKYHHCVILGEKGHGKSSFLNALFKNYGINKTLDTRHETIFTPCQIDIDEDKFIFYDTKGLNDLEYNNRIKEFIINEATNSSNRIKALLICLHIDDERFHASIREMLKEFMNCFPLKDFWEHVLIIRTFVHSPDLKEYGNLEDSVKEYLGDYMQEKKIDFPKNMNEREFFFNSVKGPKSSINTDGEIKEEFKKVLAKIKKLDPFSREIKYHIEYVREEKKDEGNFIVYYKIYRYTDSNGKTWEKIVENHRHFKVGKTGP